MEKFKVLLIGLGRIATKLENDALRYKPCTHAGALLGGRAGGYFEITGIYDTNPENEACFKRQWPALGNIQQGGIASGYDLAVIASNSESHYANALEAVEKGIRALVIEKPVTLKRAEAEHLYRLKKELGVKIWVNHERRYHPLYKKAREIYQSSVYGKPKTIRASVLTGPMKETAREYISPLLHDGTHAVDFIQWLAGNPVSVYSRSFKSDAKLEVSDQTIAVLHYPEGVNVFLKRGG